MAADGEVREFARLVKQVRAKFRHTEAATNPGLVVAPKMGRGSYPPGTSVKCVVFFGGGSKRRSRRSRNSTLNFTSDGKESLL